mgnify:CR=1 FL=1
MFLSCTDVWVCQCLSQHSTPQVLTVHCTDLLMLALAAPIGAYCAMHPYGTCASSVCTSFESMARTASVLQMHCWCGPCCRGPSTVSEHVHRVGTGLGLFYPLTHTENWIWSAVVATFEKGLLWFAVGSSCQLLQQSLCLYSVMQQQFSPGMLVVCGAVQACAGPSELPT